MTMKLQFAHQDYQKKAVDAVVKVFDGQPLGAVENQAQRLGGL